MRGSQEPRIKIEPARATTDGPDAAELMSAYGVELDEWQKTILDCWLGRDDSGRYNVFLFQGNRQYGGRFNIYVCLR